MITFARHIEPITYTPEGLILLGAAKPKPKKKVVNKKVAPNSLNFIPGGELIKKYSGLYKNPNQPFDDYLKTLKVDPKNYEGINQYTNDWKKENSLKGKKKTLPITEYNPDTNTIKIYKPTEIRPTIIDDVIDAGENVIDTTKKTFSAIGDFFSSPLFLLGAGAVGILLLIVLIKK